MEAANVKNEGMVKKALAEAIENARAAYFAAAESALSGRDSAEEPAVALRALLKGKTLPRVGSRQARSPANPLSPPPSPAFFGTDCAASATRLRYTFFEPPGWVLAAKP